MLYELRLITELMKQNDLLRTVVEAARDFCDGKTTTTRQMSQALAVLAAFDAKPEGDG